MKKRHLVIANWKMNPATWEEAKRLFNSAKKTASLLKNTDVLVCSPFLYLYPLSKINRPKNLFLGAQNVSSEEKGAFTGEVSVNMLKNLGVTFTILGHSEKRAMGETNEIIKKKLQIVLTTGLIPILCIGEKIRDKEGTHLEFIRNQIKDCLSGLPKRNLLGLIIAYEPIWAIGKSWTEAMNPTDVHEMTLFIKKMVGEIFGKDIADSFKILYGASVEPENTSLLFSQGNIDGLLVGHDSLVLEKFSAILQAADAKYL